MLPSRSTFAMNTTSTRAFAPLLRRWTRRWGLPGLEDALSVSFSSRLRRALGRSVPSEGRIILNPSLTAAATGRLPEVLCHEAAHVAAYVLHGRVGRPHGPEWASLVRAAGFTPTVHTPAGLPQRDQREPKAGRAPRFRYEHRCPVCQSTRWARRPIPRWRCADCRAAGLEGEMHITDLESHLA